MGKEQAETGVREAARARGGDGFASARSGLEPGGPLPVQARFLLSLQQTAGNQAVSGLVQRWRDGLGGEPLQGRFAPVQRQGPEDDELQMKEAPAAPAQFRPESPPRRNDTGLPAGLKSGIESLSGISLDDVRVHYGSERPARLNALAYAQGGEIHVAPGQERHLPHEAWHVVQQAQGRVQPTMHLRDRVPVNDDEGLDQEADAMGDKALASAAQRKGGPGTLPGGLIRLGADRSASRAVPPVEHGVERQRRTGNPPVGRRHSARATSVQRLPTSGTLTPPSARSVRYRAVHTALDTFHAYVVRPVGQNPHSIGAQWTSIAGLLDQVHTACVAYLDRTGRGNKAEVRTLMSATMRERVIGAALAMRLARNPAAVGVAGSTWSQQLGAAAGAGAALMNQPVDLGAAAPAAQVGGGINTLDVFHTNVGTTYFKAEKAQIDDPNTFAQGTDSRKRAEAERYKTDTAEIDANDPRLSRRDVASSRLDELLGGGVTARAEFAVRKVGGNTVSGSLMSDALGEKMGEVANAGRLTANAAVGDAQHFGGNDPGLQRRLSRLQLLDAIALQIDRHLGNFFIHKDSQQRVDAVTGIDNDMSWGERGDVRAKGVHEFMGLSRFVDEELALRIVHLDDEDLRWVLTGLLSDAEIAAAVARLGVLKQHLSQLASAKQLLRPDDWNQATAAGMFAEGRSYFSRTK